VSERTTRIRTSPRGEIGAGSEMLVQDGEMGVDVLTEIVIDRPCAQVAAYAGDPTNAPRWYVNIESVEWRTPEPVVIGSRMDFVG
jgi:uncharacterized membrane protein